jgi:predicted DNA-binding transcriptional regulator AlpA
MVTLAPGAELLLRVEEVAQTLRLSRASTYLLIQRGEIPTIHNWGFGASAQGRTRALG